ncbi:MAG: hypothetical protein WCX65_14340 [bacterium]
MKSKKIQKIIVAAATAACMTMAVTGAAATEFWETYSNKMVENYAVKSGSIYEPGMNQRLTANEVLAVSSKSFSQSFGMRFAEVAKSHRGLAFVCIFSREPERCYLDSVMKSTFDEVKFLPTPKFSQKFVKKFSKFYASSLMKPKAISGKEIRSAAVPRRNPFNPRFGFTLNDFEIVAASPFYTFKGIYVEPQWGTRHGPSLGFMKSRLSLDIDNDGAAFQYTLPKSFNSHTQLKLTVRADGNIYIDNVFITW